MEMKPINRCFIIICHLYPSIVPSAYLYIYLSTYRHTYYLLDCLSTHLPIYPPIYYLYIDLSNSPSIHQSIRPPIQASIQVHICPLCITIAVCSRFNVCLCARKVKVPFLRATKALRVGRGIALPFLRPRH